MMSELIPPEVHVVLVVVVEVDRGVAVPSKVHWNEFNKNSIVLPQS